MTREEKVAEARRLRDDEGLTHREIASRLGVKRPAVTKWLNPNAREWSRRSESRPERKLAKRAWENEHDRQPCPRCGEPMGVGSHRGSDRCRKCWRDDEAARHTAYMREFERLWNEGRTIRDLAAHFGLTRGAVSVSVDKARSEGYHLPYRYRLSNPRFEDQVAA